MSRDVYSLEREKGFFFQKKQVWNPGEDQPRCEDQHRHLVGTLQKLPSPATSDIDLDMCGKDQ